MGYADVFKRAQRSPSLWNTRSSNNQDRFWVLFPSCNWDNASLAGFGSDWVFPLFIHYPGRARWFGFHSQPPQVSFLFLSSLLSHRPLLFLLNVGSHGPNTHFFSSHRSPSCITLSHAPSFPRILFWTTSCDSLQWRDAERAGGRNRRGWWEIGQPKVSWAIFAGGLIV